MTNLPQYLNREDIPVLPIKNWGMQETVYWKKEPGFNSVIWSWGRTEYKLLHILVITICHLNTNNVNSEQEALPLFLAEGLLKTI